MARLKPSSACDVLCGSFGAVDHAKLRKRRSVGENEFCRADAVLGAEGQGAREETVIQLDIFEHSRDVMLRNAVLDALERHDAAAACAACAQLGQDFPLDASVAAFCTLPEAINGGARARFVDHDALQNSHRFVDESWRPAALSVFSAEGATKWLAPRYTRLALRAEHLPFDADHASDHAAPLRMRAVDWHAAERAIAGIESWRRMPQPLAWMVETRL